MAYAPAPADDGEGGVVTAPLLHDQRRGRQAGLCACASLALGLGLVGLAMHHTGAMARILPDGQARLHVVVEYTNVNCGWLAGDDCLNMDKSACLCRAMNPKGRCKPCDYDALLKIGAVQPTLAGKLSPEVIATNAKLLESMRDGPHSDEHEEGDEDLKELFCYMLIRPSGGELELARTARSLHAGIYNEACDGRRVYSSSKVKIVDGEYTEAVVDASGAPLSMQCDYSSDWHLALNAKIFYSFWQYLLKDNSEIFRFRWSAKVDADTVFLPQRLRPALTAHEETRATFVNYCPFEGEYGHGPIEVISREGFRNLRAGVGKIGGLSACQDFLKSDPTNREDWFMGQCLERNGAKRIELSVVSEDTCPPSPKPGIGCGGKKAAFHPHKDVESWRSCWKQAATP